MATNKTYGDLRPTQQCLNQDKDILYRHVYLKSTAMRGTGSTTAVSVGATVTLTVAQVLQTLLVLNPSAASAVTLPSAASLLAQFPQALPGDVINICILRNSNGTNAITLTAPDGNVEIVGATVATSTNTQLKMLVKSSSTVAIISL